MAAGRGVRLGVKLEREAAQALVAHVGERQQRLLRELEKLALELGDGAGSASRRSSRRPRTPPSTRSGGSSTRSSPATAAATRAYLELAAQGEAVDAARGLLARRVREVLSIAQRLEAGENPQQIKAGMKGNPWALDRRIAEARRSDADRLARALDAVDSSSPRTARPS